MVAQNIFFGIISAAMVLAAVRVVTTQNVVRAALALIIVLTGAAAQFILLSSEFVAVVQLMVYVGAIVVLLLFGVMLTRAPIGKDTDLDNDQRAIAFIVALGVVGILGSSIWKFFERVKLPSELGSSSSTTVLSDSIFSTYVIPFEIVSVLLLAALVGAIVVARRD